MLGDSACPSTPTQRRHRLPSRPGGGRWSWLLALLLWLIPAGPAAAPALHAAGPEFRSIDGSGNNLAHPDWGRAGVQLLRKAAPAYADGSAALSGPERPNPRAVSNAVVRQTQSVLNTAGATDMLWQWGQFLDHDLDLTVVADPPEPANIPIPADDEVFGVPGFLPFQRSAFDPATGTGAGNPRQQTNVLTAFVDASNVYGSDAARALALRTLDGTGRLKTSPGDLLPFNTGGLPNGPNNAAQFFLAGDVRSNEQLGLTAVHTLWVREHNRLADEIRAADSSLSDEAIYQRARRLVGALMQVITYREFLPLLLGEDALPPYPGYDPTVNPGIHNEFSTAAFRLGHTLLSPRIMRLDADGEAIAAGHLALREAFFRPDRLVNEGGIEPLLRGLSAQPAQELDVFVVDDVRNFLFGPPGAGGLDLPSLNLQRGRDHGLPAYNVVRQAYGLPPVATFAQITADPEVQARLAGVYGTVDRVDPWVGGLAEDRLAGAMVGPLWRAVLVDQFRRVRDGDRFWYERSFTGDELASLQATRLSDVIRRNTVIGPGEIPDNAFKLATMSDLSVSQAVSRYPAMAGDMITLSVKAENKGWYPALGVVMTDALSGMLRFQAHAADPGAQCSVPPVGESGTVRCRWAAPTAVGAARRITVTARVCTDEKCGPAMVSLARVASEMPEARLADNVSQMTVPVVAQADLVLLATQSSPPAGQSVAVREQVTYTVQVANQGYSVARDAVLVATLPPQLSFDGAPLVSGGGSCGAPQGQVVTCQLGAITPDWVCQGPAAPTRTITVVAQVDAAAAPPGSPGPCTGGVVRPTFAVTDANCMGDARPDDNTAAVPTCLVVRPVLDPASDLRPRPLLPEGTVGRVETTDSTAAAAHDPCVVGRLDLAVGPIINDPDLATAPVWDDPAEPELRITNAPGIEVTGCRLQFRGGGQGRCQAHGGVVDVNMMLPVGAAVEVFWTVYFQGGLAANHRFASTACALWDANGNGAIDPDEADCENGTPPGQVQSARRLLDVQCPATVRPNDQLGKQVHLPILRFQGRDDVCRTWIEVQVVGAQHSKAVLVAWGEPGFCPPQCAGPLKVECTGLLKPGTTWNLLGAQIPSGAKGAMLFKFTARRIREIDPNFGGEDDIVADYMCETLFFGVVGDCDDWRRFKKAYNEGLAFGGLPMSTASGEGYLAVDVLRHCPADVTPGAEVSSKYNGVAGDHLGSFDPLYGGYGFYAPLLYADKAGFNSVMYIQNGGLECSSIELWFKAQDDCLRAKICEVFTLAPGETFQFDATDCVGPDWQGSAWLRSSQPLGAVVDILGRDVLMTYVAEPAAFAYGVDPAHPNAGLGFDQGNLVAYGPLIYSEYQGWDTGVQVQNLSATGNAKVKVYFLDRGGDVITTLVDWICPRGSQTYFLPVIASLPGNWVGGVRVESQEWWTPGSPAVVPPSIVGVATMIKYTDAARTQTAEAIAYNLLPEHKAFDWQVGFGAGGLDSGTGLIAIPSLLRDLEATTVTSELAIANLVPKPGFTDFAIFLYDQNGLLDYVCQKLNEKQVEYIDLATWGYVTPGFKGSAIISATYWEHDVFDASGRFLRNLVGMAAVAVERTGTRLGEDVPGDEAAGARGIPFAATGGALEFYPAGPSLPLCPGVGRSSR